MAYSYTEYTGDGSTTSFNVSFSYFSTEHVVVYIDNVKNDSFTIETNLQTLTLDVAPEEGASILIRRVTPRDRTYSTFTRGNRFGESSVNNSFLWLLYIAQELLEGGFSDLKLSGDLNLNGNKIINVADCTDDNDAVNLGFLNRMISTLNDTYHTMVDTVTQAVSDALGYRDDTQELYEDVVEVIDSVTEYQLVEDIILQAGQTQVTFNKVNTIICRYHITGSMVDGSILTSGDFEILNGYSIKLSRSYPEGTILRAIQVVYKNNEQPIYLQHPVWSSSIISVAGQVYLYTYDGSRYIEVYDPIGGTALGDSPLTNSNILPVSGFYNVCDFGALPATGYDLAPILQSLIRSNVEIIIPEGTYEFRSNRGAITGVARSPCVWVDGIENCTIRGVGNVSIEIAGDQLDEHSSFFTFYTTIANNTLGLYNKNITLRDFEMVFNSGVLPDTSNPNISGLNTTSTEDCLFENLRFRRGVTDSDTNILAITGTGGLNNIYRGNHFINCSTCYDHSEMYYCQYLDNMCYCDIASDNTSVGVTAFNHFYDTTTVSNVRFSTGTQGSIAKGNIYRGNVAIGFSCGFAIRGMQNSLIDANYIYKLRADRSDTASAISIYTMSNESDALSLNVKGINITNNVIEGGMNIGEGSTAGISIGSSGLNVVGTTLAFNRMQDMGDGFLIDSSSSDSVYYVGNQINSGFRPLDEGH